MYFYRGFTFNSSKLPTRQIISAVGAEDLKLKNMTASAKGTVEAPGKNVAQKSGLNRAILDVAHGQLRRMIAYKADWNGGTLTCVNPQFTSQYCSACGRHPKDDSATKHIAHGRIIRNEFVCPLCQNVEDADINAKCCPLGAELNHPQQMKSLAPQELWCQLVNPMG